MIYALKEKLKHGRYTNRIYSLIRFGIFGGEAKKVNKRKRESLQKNGVQTIFFIQDLLEKSGKKFFLDMGTLLGIIREGRILSHDLDIDVAVYTTDAKETEAFVQYLVSNGCVHTYSYVSETLGVIEDSFTVNDIKFDINYYSSLGDTDVCYLAYVSTEEQVKTGEMNVVKLTCDAIEETSQIEFCGFMVNIPQGAEAYLARRYGKNWRIPDRGWVYWQGPSTEQISDTCRRVNPNSVNEA